MGTRPRPRPRPRPRRRLRPGTWSRVVCWRWSWGPSSSWGTTTRPWPRAWPAVATSLWRRVRPWPESHVITLLLLTSNYRCCYMLCCMNGLEGVDLAAIKISRISTITLNWYKSQHNVNSPPAAPVSWGTGIRPWSRSINRVKPHITCWFYNIHVEWSNANHSRCETKALTTSLGNRLYLANVSTRCSSHCEDCIISLKCWQDSFTKQRCHKENHCHFMSTGALRKISVVTTVVQEERTQIIYLLLLGGLRLNLLLMLSFALLFDS